MTNFWGAWIRGVGMISVKLCRDLSDELIFSTFKEGFSDYFIQMEMTQDSFMAHFFGPEGNTKDQSFVAYKDDVVAGILLGGIRELDGIKTLRCGGMSVIPSARKKGVAREMMAIHEKMARQAGVHQLFLEVLTINESAFKFYENIGYEKVYDLTYRSFTPDADWFDGNPEMLLADHEAFHSIQQITLTDLEGLRHIDESHLPWQGSLEAVSMMDVTIFGVYKNGQLIAGLIGNQTRLFYIYVSPGHRLKGVGKALLMTYLQTCKVERCRFVYTNNARLHTFANHLNMTTGEYGQYEYYKWLE
jgi:GNAT superfamily N-acetyltransferase